MADWDALYELKTQYQRSDHNTRVVIIKLVMQDTGWDYDGAKAWLDS
jgi:hypothetical protein